MKNDEIIQKNVMEELRWVPALNASEIGVGVKNGIVTLSGSVDSYPKKIKAERAVSKIAGVRGIAEDITVKLDAGDKRSDSDIAQTVLKELEWHSATNIDRIKIFVEDGCVTLEGTVDWDYQRKSASKVLIPVKGVRKIINNIKIKPSPVPAEIKEKIQASFLRKANIDANNIKIEVQGNKIILTGKVRNLEEKKDAENSVWSAPGVAHVDNFLECDDELQIK